VPAAAVLEAEWAAPDQRIPVPQGEAEAPVAELTVEPVVEELPFPPVADDGVAAEAHEYPLEDEVLPVPEEAPAEEPAVFTRPRRERGRRRRRDGERAEEPVSAAPVAEAPLPAPAPAAKPERARDRERAPERDRDRAAERLVKEIIVNVDPRETRIAVIENSRLVELHVEREERVVGSIYKGKVANVLPGMDAAFVEIGLERNAFLYVGDILYESNEENGTVQHRRAGREIKIRDVAKTGQEILVQVVKGPRGTKGARVSTRMSLPGRYIVLMPEADNLGVSRKIDDADERERLKKAGEAIRPNGYGMIIRTEAEGKSEADLRQDLDLLIKQWRQIQEKSRRTPPPGLVHQDLSLILKTIRDVFGSDVDRLLMDSPSDFRKVQELLEVLSPKLVSRVELYQGAEPIFSKFGLDQEIERLLRRKVWLKSGGYISIDSTEALTAIDVNTGKFIGTTSLSDTILKTNLDAVTEITRQLRLRDIGGMIIIDFIDMSSARDRAQVMAALDKALKKDRTRTKVAHISPLGLVEMTRKRTGETVTDLLTDSCPYCQGRGRVSSPESVSIHIAREIQRRCSQNDVDAILVHASPDVAAHLIGPEGDNVEALEKEVRRPIYVRARHEFHVEKFEVMAGDMLEIEQQLMPYRGGQVVECQVQKMELIAAPRSAAWVDGYFVDLANGTRFQGQKARVRLTDVRRSFALGEAVPPASALDKSEPI
jgi:ribonuclease G